MPGMDGTAVWSMLGRRVSRYMSVHFSGHPREESAWSKVQLDTTWVCCLGKLAWGLSFAASSHEVEQKQSKNVLSHHSADSLLT